MKRIALLVVFCLITTLAGYAQTPSKVETKVINLVKKYENTAGVECMTVVRGGGLEMVKMMFNKQFGKEFMRGVRSITIIDYTEASATVCQSLRKEIDTFTSLLEEYDLEGSKEFAEHSYIRSFGTSSGENTLSDFMIALENSDSKVIMYMAGVIKLE